MLTTTRAGLALAVMLTFGLPAKAVEISFNPLETTTLLGTTFGVDIVVAGLSSSQEIVSAFDLDVLFDNSILDFNRVVFSDALGVVDSDTFTSFSVTPGRVDLANLSLLSNADLLASQGNQIVLASLFFDAIGLGASLLSFDGSVLGGIDLVGLDPFSNLTLDAVGSSTIAVSGTHSVPEPGAVALFGIALAGLGIARARRRRTEYRT